MNSKLRKIIYHISQHPLDDEDHEFDEDFEAAEKAIRQAVGEEMLEIIGENDHETRGTTQNPNNEKYHTRKSKNRNELKAEIRQKIKQWQGGEDET